MSSFYEEDVHQHLYSVGLEKVIEDCPTFDADYDELSSDRLETCHSKTEDESPIELWTIIKQKAFEKLERLHGSVRYGSFVGSKVKLPTDLSRPMELDLLGTHEDGIFILELKVNKAAERNAFSELFAYSNYIADAFPLSGHKDITNVLVASMDAKITKQAFLYDLLISDRNTIVYLPVFGSSDVQSLSLQLYIPSDDDFKQFTNELLSHEAMSCAVISFEDIEGWFDSIEEQGAISNTTRHHLSMLSGYTAQLMEAEHLHGFCFMRKPWETIPRYYRNSLFICALNPFRFGSEYRKEALLSQLDETQVSDFLENPRLAFEGRLIRIAQQAVADCLTHHHRAEVELPLWSAIVQSPVEVAFSHNFAFRPTGILREAYKTEINNLYAAESNGTSDGEDISVLKVNELSNWLRAWQFMHACGLADD